MTHDGQRAEILRLDSPVRARTGAEIDVLPAALADAAAATRAFARELEPVTLRAGVLSDALRAFDSSWARAGQALAQDAERAADDLQRGCRTYSKIESLLVPRALR